MSHNIVQVVGEFSTEGGVETVAWELARAWDRANIANSVIARVTSSEQMRDGKVQCIAPWLARVPTRGAFRHTGRLVVVPAFTLAATRALQAHGNAVIVSHGDSLGGDILVVHSVNKASLEEKRKAGNWAWRVNPMHLWVSARDQWMIGGLRYRRFVAVSPRVGTELQTYYGVPDERIRVIPNGIDLDRFKPDAVAGMALRRDLGIPKDARVLLFVSHEFDRKGLACVIGALGALGENTWLVAVGSDNPAPYRQMAGAAAGRVVFAGARRNLPDFYAAADAFVLPTAYETFSLVCMEAMACGVPVFATRVGGIEDYLVDGVNGNAITRDSGSIVQALAVLDRPDELAALRAGASATAKRFGWDGIAARYLDVIDEVALEKFGERRAA